MYLEFAHPWMLIILPVAAVFIIWFSKYIRSRSLSRRIGMTTLRCLILALVVFAISGVSVHRKNNMTTTIFLVDLSDSTNAVQEQEEEFVRRAIADMPAENQAGIVVFGSDARIEQFVSDKKVFSAFQSEVTASATNLEQAVQTALALFPDDTARRLVLLTDGSENEGSIESTAHSFSGSNVEFNVVTYDSSVKSEVYVSDVSLPDTIRQGDSFQVQAEIYATEAGNATVSLYSGRTLKGQKDVTLQKGYNQLLFSDEGVEGGLKSYRVTVESQNDTVSVNNTYSAFTTVEARAKLLLVEGAAGQGTEFSHILDACNFDYDLVTPAGVPAQIADMNQYSSVVLLDVYADDLREGFLDTLETYVKDYAGGLIAIGGSNSFALGNYKNTPLETVLPVSMDLEGEKEIPKLAMAMVIDHSGSMSSASTEQSSISCMEVAKQAATKALDSLREIDEVGVLAFDDSFTWAVPLTPAVDKETIASNIGGIQALGGTSIYPALAEAVSKLKESDASLKHIILLTDGQDGFHQYSDVLREMNDNGITLSTVAIGTGADSKTLTELAENGNGRYYYSDAGTSLPRIFAQEVYLSSKSYLINEEFVPTIVNSHEIIKDIFTDGSPSLLGYIAATPKPSSTVLLESDREDPVLTVWQYGLGRSVAWNSDGVNAWTGNFAQWENYPALWRNIIDWTISDSDLGSDTLQVTQEASSIIIDYGTDEYTTATEVKAVLTDEEGNQQDVTLKAVSPGKYRAKADVDEVGVYSINLRKQNGEEIIKNINTASVLQYSQEYRYAEITNNLDGFVNQIGGRYLTEPKEVFETDLDGNISRTDITQALLVLAVLLFVLDIVMRRLHLDWLAFVGNFALWFKGKMQTAGKTRKQQNTVSENIHRNNDTAPNLEMNETGKINTVNKLNKINKKNKENNANSVDSINSVTEISKSDETKEKNNKSGTTENDHEKDSLKQTSADNLKQSSKNNWKRKSRNDLKQNSGNNLKQTSKDKSGEQSNVIDISTLLKKKQDRDF